MLRKIRLTGLDSISELMTLGSLPQTDCMPGLNCDGATREFTVETNPQTRIMKLNTLLKRLANPTAGLSALLALTSCSSTTPAPMDENTPGATFQKGVPGGTLVETRKLTATVTAIDAASRKVTIVSSEGKPTTVKCSPEVINFDQIHVGDLVKVTVTAELAVAMADADAPRSDSGAGLVALAPKGAKPGGLMAETQQYTATVTGINLKRHEASLLFPDRSTRTFAVRKDVDLNQRKVGEQVAISVTVAVAISVEKP